MNRLRAQKIIFLGEQDGAIEQELKNVLSRYLSGIPNVSAAYLARVSYAESPQPKVALCLSGGSEDALGLVTSIQGLFSKRFSATQSLDILFLSEPQLTVINFVAKPFYPQANSSSEEHVALDP
jgi:hypothetical protein